MPQAAPKYAVASLFGAGSGIAATLGMMKARLETDPSICYSILNGVSAGALIVAWLSHCNMADSKEVGTPIYPN